MSRSLVSKVFYDLVDDMPKINKGRLASIIMFILFMFFLSIAIMQGCCPTVKCPPAEAYFVMSDGTWAVVGEGFFDDEDEWYRKDQKARFERLLQEKVLEYWEEQQNKKDL